MTRRRAGYDWTRRAAPVAAIALGVALIAAGITQAGPDPLVLDGTRPATQAETDAHRLRDLEDLLRARAGLPLAHETAAP